jgi:hypothetical protein
VGDEGGKGETGEVEAAEVLAVSGEQSQLILVAAEMNFFVFELFGGIIVVSYRFQIFSWLLRVLLYFYQFFLHYSYYM